MNLYAIISDRLNRVDFAALWPGFTRVPFALYDEKTVDLGDREIPRDDRFLGNTAILLDGKWTAIWNAAGNEDPDELAAGMVHEMFHAFQYARGETRFPNDLEILRLGIDDGELGLRALECALLAEEHPSLARFADARARRRAANPPLTREAEWAETAEGMAEYMGVAALSMIAPEKGAIARAAHRERLLDRSILHDTRRIAYFSGALLLAAAQDAGYTCFHDVGRETRALGEIVLSQIAPESAGDAPDVSCLVQAETARMGERCRLFRAENVRYERHAWITGYDPMNMTRAGDFVLCTRFVMLDGALITGPILLEMAPGSKNEVHAIYREECGIISGEEG